MAMNVMVVIVMTLEAIKHDSDDDARIELAFLDTACWIEDYLVLGVRRSAIGCIEHSSDVLMAIVVVASASAHRLSMPNIST